MPVRLGMQITNVKQRQILPRVGKIWVCTPRCTSHLGMYAAKTEPTGGCKCLVIFTVHYK